LEDQKWFSSWPFPARGLLNMVLALQIFAIILIILLIVLTSIIILKEFKEYKENLNQEDNQQVSMNDFLSKI